MRSISNPTTTVHSISILDCVGQDCLETLKVVEVVEVVKQDTAFKVEVVVLDSKGNRRIDTLSRHSAFSANLITAGYTYRIRN